MSEEMKEYAYEDQAFPIGYGQTISQPYTIAFMLNLLELEKKGLNILEIGSGSGYVLALINEICENCQLTGIEKVKELADRSWKILKNKKNIRIICKNGFRGLPGNKFDRILVSASAAKVPKHLFDQLSEHGVLVCPVRNSIFQFKKLNNKIIKKEFYGFIFVPLIQD